MSLSSHSFPRKSPTEINVLIVGAGFAGLTAAIECHRKGHSVVLLEAFPRLQPLGDIISFGPNSGRIFQRWEGVEEQLDPICHRSEGLVLKTYTGETLFTQTWEEEKAWGKKFNGHRGEIHEIVFRHALERGVDVRLGKRVVDYFETEEEAGVVVVDVDSDSGSGEERKGERIVADVVLAADGVRSTGRRIVLGHEDRPRSSGYAIYRAWFDSDELMRNPLTRHLVAHGDTHTGWIGPDVHFLAASIKGGREFSWVCTHRDEADIQDSWSTPGNVADALKVVKDWDPVVQEIVKATPPSRLVDWKLIYRDPLPTWLSPRARIALIGDAAHPFLPTSIQGASQAMEDGATLAVCLELAAKRKDGVQTALRAYERIRYDRVLAAQKTGETTRDRWHKADFANIKKNPEAVKLRREKWLLDFDAERHAYEVYEKTVREVEEEKERARL